jgi:hypothetical protein
MDRNQIPFDQLFPSLRGVHTETRKKRIIESMVAGFLYLFMGSAIIIVFLNKPANIPDVAHTFILRMMVVGYLLVLLGTYRRLLDIWLGKRVFTEETVHDTFFGFVRLRTWSAAYTAIWMLDLDHHEDATFLIFRLYDKTTHRMRCTDGMRRIIDHVVASVEATAADERP